MNAPQFGEREESRDYPDRPAAFVVVEARGLIAVVRVESGGREGALDLPGGGLDPGESEAQAAVRECGEEAGLKVAVEDTPFARADHFFVSGDGARRNTRGAFFAGWVTAEAPELKTETDTLFWMDPAEAIARLDRESHAWAVAAWLRRLHGGA